MVRKPTLSRRMVPALALALIASFLFSALAASSASATPQRWYSCKNVGSSLGAYTDPACQSAGKGNYDWSSLTATPTAFALEGSTPITLSATIALTKISINCSSAQASGTIANPAGEGAGTLSTLAGSSLVLSGCAVAEDEGCKIQGGAINFNALTGKGTEFEGHSVELQSTVESQFAKFKLEACNKPALKNVTVTVTGIISAFVNQATSSLQFTEAGSASLKMNGGKAVIKGTAKVETAAKEALRLGVSTPVNTVLPTTSPENPLVGTVLTAGNGSWAHEPTSYSYQWKRCNSVGTECQVLIGKTNSTYIAEIADEYQTLAVEVTAANPAGSSVPASSKPSKIVGPQPGPYHWYSCQEGVFSPQYVDAGCQSESPVGKYGWGLLTAGSSVGFTSKNATPIKLKFIHSTITYTIECASGAGSGTVKNPTGGGDGTLSGGSTLLALNGCKFTTPAGTKCQVSGESITSAAVEGKTDRHSVAISNGGTLFSFQITNCSLEGFKTISGTLNGVINNANSSLEFGSGSGAELKFAGLKTWVEGGIHIETNAGEELKLAP